MLGARAAWRARVVAFGRRAEGGDGNASHGPHAGHGVALPPTTGGMRWAELMRRTFGFDALASTACGGRLRLIALIMQPAVIARLLRHLGLPTGDGLPHGL